eukprot:418660-Prorocentrum_minimum.AAC.1
MLETQYRMHPAICAFPSNRFYEDRLQSAPHPSKRVPPQGAPLASPQCVIFPSNRLYECPDGIHPLRP